MTIELKYKKIHPNAQEPVYATAGAACFDLFAASIDKYSYTIPGNPVVVGTGLQFEIPEGWVMNIYSRSGHGFKNAVRLANCVGKIDSDYRGEVKVALTSDDVANIFPSLLVKVGDRIAQAELVKLDRVSFVAAEALSETERGTGGFGSTGAT